jgi:hypothetical protein
MGHILYVKNYKRCDGAECLGCLLCYEIMRIGEIFHKNRLVSSVIMSCPCQSHSQTFSILEQSTQESVDTRMQKLMGELRWLHKEQFLNLYSSLIAYM